MAMVYRSEAKNVRARTSCRSHFGADPASVDRFGRLDDAVRDAFCKRIARRCGFRRLMP